jgi:hypothetical protein
MKCLPFTVHALYAAISKTSGLRDDNNCFGDIFEEEFMMEKGMTPIGN